jgi:hypothetical protein
LWIAIGSLATAVVAILTFVTIVVIPRYRRSKFSIEFEFAQPFVRPTVSSLLPGTPQPPATPPSGTRVPSFWVRVRVKNSGRRAAKRCIAKLARVVDHNGKKVEPLDPLYLHWVGTSWGDVPFRQVDLDRDDSEFLDVLMTQQGNPHAWLAGDQFPWARYEPRGIVKVLPQGKYVLTITVYGDDVQPETRHLSVRWGALDERDISARLSKSPKYRVN